MLISTALVFCFDDNYVVPFKVFFGTLLSTDSIPEGVSLYFLHTDALGPVSISGLADFLDSLGWNATFIDASIFLPHDLPVSMHVSLSAYLRLFIAEALPAHHDNAVYMDVDMLALKSAADVFYTKPLQPICAVDHMLPLEGLRLWGDCMGSYFNSGLLLLSLCDWRRKGFTEECLHVIENQSDRIRWWDQDVLNIVFADKWQRLPIWLNLTSDARRLLPCDLVRSKGILVHLTGGGKPWYGFNVQFSKEWDDAYEAIFANPFDRRSIQPSLYRRLKHSIKRRIQGSHGLE